MKKNNNTICKTKERSCCSSCKYWNNKQAELEYSIYHGICTCYKWKFSINGNADCLVLDRKNRTETYIRTNRFENQSKQVPIGKTEQSRYCFVTEKNFGCIHYEKI